MTSTTSVVFGVSLQPRPADANCADEAFSTARTIDTRTIEVELQKGLDGGKQAKRRKAKWRRNRKTTKCIMCNRLELAARNRQRRLSAVICILNKIKLFPIQPRISARPTSPVKLFGKSADDFGCDVEEEDGCDEGDGENDDDEGVTAACKLRS
jgi:hypothetical protein